MIDGAVQLTRVSLGATLGLGVGVAAFFLVPMVQPEPDPHARWGLLLWYPTMGALIACIGRARRLTSWLVGAAFGAWLNTVLAFFSHRQMQRFLDSAFGVESPLASPALFVIEGAVVGALIGFVVDRFGTEG